MSGMSVSLDGCFWWEQADLALDLWHGWARWGVLPFKGPDTWTIFITLFISQVTWTPILLASVWDKPNPFRVNPANLGPPPCLGVREAPRHRGGGGWGCLVFLCHRCPSGPAEMHVIPIGLAPSPPFHFSGTHLGVCTPTGVSALIICSAVILPPPVPVTPVLETEEKHFSLYPFEFLAEGPVNKRQIQKRKKKKNREVYEYTCTWETPSKTE